MEEASQQVHVPTTFITELLHSSYFFIIQGSPNELSTSRESLA